MDYEKNVKVKSVSEKPNMSPSLGGSRNSKLDKQAQDVKVKDASVYVKAGKQDQAKQAGA